MNYSKFLGYLIVIVVNVLALRVTHNPNKNSDQVSSGLVGYCSWQDTLLTVSSLVIAVMESV